MRLAQRLVWRLFRQRPDAIDRAAARFTLDGETRERLARLGTAFLGGYHAALTAPSIAGAFAGVREVPTHERPFWAEGTAMGLAPRAWFDRSCRAAAQDALLRREASAFLYLGYVGLGVWYGFRHPRHPERIERDLAPHLAALYVPLCYDGWGFKHGFFDRPRRLPASATFERCQHERRRALWQGFGRAMFFALSEDEAAFRALLAEAGGETARDLESGRSLALAFTGIDRPEAIVSHLQGAGAEGDLAARLLGTTWALTARWRADEGYFAACVEGAPPRWRNLLHELPLACLAAERESRSYLEWQERTIAAARVLYDAP
jgi:hypothetical protein